MIFGGAGYAQAEGKRGEAASPAVKVLTDRLGDFEARGSALEVTVNVPGDPPTAAFEITARAGRDYFSPDGRRLVVNVATTRTESAAYSLLTYLTRNAAVSSEPRAVAIGTAGVVSGRNIYFFRGSNCAIVGAPDTSTASLDEGLTLARALAASLHKGEDEIPVLVKHLPDSQNARPLFAVSLATLETIVPGQPIIRELSFEGGTEAVAASYGQSQLVIVEFTTPQFSVDNDQRIWTKISELKRQGQPIPTAYRRVGNYSVFVFNAPDEKTANELLEQVDYEQVVQWLGDDPYLYQRLEKYLAQTSAGVLVAVVTSSGLSLVICASLGALIGTLLFRHRRAQKAALYSDAGGSVRLNLDDLTGPSNPARLLGSGRPESDSN